MTVITESPILIQSGKFYSACSDLVPELELKYEEH